MIRLLLIWLLLAAPGAIPVVTAQGALPEAGEAAEQERSYIRITDIRITGNKRTRPEIILREMSVQPGFVINPDSLSFLLQQNKLRIFNIALFNEVLIDTIHISSREMAWHVQVKERWYIWPEFSFALADRNFNVWWTEQGRDIRRANIGMTIKDKNFRGNMEQLGVKAQIGYTQQFAIEYFRPYVDRQQRHGFGVSVSARQNNETFFNTDSNKLEFARSRSHYVIRQNDATLLYTYRPGYATRHIFMLGWRDYRAHDTIVQLNPDYYLGGSRLLQMAEVHYRFDINRVDNWNYPLVGNKLVSSSIIRVGIRGMRFQALTQLEAGAFRQPLPRWYVSSIFRGRLSLPELQPYVLRSGMGNGSDYVRGYEYYVADGAHYAIMRLNLKRELFNRTLHRIPIPYLPNIPIRIYPKVFADAGYAHNRFAGNSFLNNRMLYAAGGGVDIITAYDLKLRLEYAWNHLGQHALYLHMHSE
jgi:hypothetical protein